MSPGQCVFTFYNTTSMRIRCTSDVPSNLTSLPETLWANSYFRQITRIDFGRRIASLPLFACSLPSRRIDLTGQAFTVLNESTFPCLDRFESVNMAYNNLTSINLPQTLEILRSLDLSYNSLTTLPYSLLQRLPPNLNSLDLSGNSITSIDTILFTLRNIRIDLRNNRVDKTSLTNLQNRILLSWNASQPPFQIVLDPAGEFVLNDRMGLVAGACTPSSILTLRDALQSSDDVRLDCSCASINLKEIFRRAGSNILDNFTCSSEGDPERFNTLSIATCSETALNFATGLCLNESLKVRTFATRSSHRETSIIGRIAPFAAIESVDIYRFVISPAGQTEERVNYLSNPTPYVLSASRKP
jgi:Leucine-rich repeat (LRR) protein